MEKVLDRLVELEAEYNRIRNYEYDAYDSEFEALERATEIEITFRLLEINLDKISR
jgi:hypothetical protein